jgi:hypothetical protein
VVSTGGPTPTGTAGRPRAARAAAPTSEATHPSATGSADRVRPVAAAPVALSGDAPRGELPGVPSDPAVPATPSSSGSAPGALALAPSTAVTAPVAPSTLASPVVERDLELDDLAYSPGSRPD